MHAMTDRQIAEARAPLTNGRWSLPTHVRTNVEATNDAMVLAAPASENDEPCDCVWPCDACLLREIGNG